MKILIHRSLALGRAFRRLWLNSAKASQTLFATTLERFCDLTRNGFCGFARIRRLGNRPTNHQIAGASLNRFPGSGDAFLVACCSSRGPDSRNDQDSLSTGNLPQPRSLVRRADKAANAGRNPHTGQRFCLLAGSAVDGHGTELSGIHTGEHGNCEQLGRVGKTFQSGAGSGEHRRTAESVHRDHAHPVRGGGANRSRHGVGDVVKLEIEENGMAAANQRLDDRRTGSREQFQADFEPVAMPFEPVDQVKSGSRSWRVQSYDEALTCFFKAFRRQGGRRTGSSERGVQTFGDGHTEIVKQEAIGTARRQTRKTGGWGTGDPELKRSSLGMRRLALGLALIGACGTAWATTINTNPMNYDPQVQKAYAEFHELDFKDAVAGFTRYHDEHPGDPQATAYLLNAEVFQELYRLDLLDTTFYANDGFLSGKHATIEDPVAKARIMALANEVVREANWRLSQNPNDVNALFARGWARSLECTYIAMVERGFSAGFRLATKAKDDEVRVLQLDPNYADAKLIVGVYQYVVGALPWPFKFLIGFAGITGSKTKGMALLQQAGEQGVITSAEARTVMALFLRREGKYKQAIAIIQGLEAEYPHDFLYHLEEANLRKDDGEGMAAVDAYREVIADAGTPGYFASAKLELADFGLGEALRGQRYYKQAAQAYEHAAKTQDVGTELKIRSLVAGGECRDLANQRQLAVDDYRNAIEAGPNTTRADTARRYLHSRYHGS